MNSIFDLNECKYDIDLKKMRRYIFNYKGVVKNIPYYLCF